MLEDWAQMSKMLDFNLTPTFFEGGLRIDKLQNVTQGPLRQRPSQQNDSLMLVWRIVFFQNQFVRS